MFEYEISIFDPPAPAAQVELKTSEGLARVADIMLLIDSGADITLIPRWSIEQLRISPVKGKRYELMGFDGSRSYAEVVVLDMILLQQVFRGSYLLTEAEHGVLGRDVLNHIALFLNGPELKWAAMRPKPDGS